MSSQSKWGELNCNQTLNIMCIVMIVGQMHVVQLEQARLNDLGTNNIYKIRKASLNSGKQWQTTGL